VIFIGGFSVVSAEPERKESKRKKQPYPSFIIPENHFILFSGLCLIILWYLSDSGHLMLL
jgi:hypothetical protein